MIRHKSKAPCRLSLSGKSFTTMEMPQSSNTGPITPFACDDILINVTLKQY